MKLTSHTGRRFTVTLITWKHTRTSNLASPSCSITEDSRSLIYGHPPSHGTGQTGVTGHTLMPIPNQAIRPGAWAWWPPGDFSIVICRTMTLPMQYKAWVYVENKKLPTCSRGTWQLEMSLRLKSGKQRALKAQNSELTSKFHSKCRKSLWKAESNSSGTRP